MTKKKIALISGIMSIILVGVLLTLLLSGAFNPVERQLSLAYKFLSEGNYVEAILAFDKAIEINSKDLRPRIGKTNILIHNGDEGAAADTFDDLINIDSPKWPETEKPKGYDGEWYSFEELVEWYLNYNVTNGLEDKNEPFVAVLEKWGFDLYDREKAPVSDKESGEYEEEFLLSIKETDKNIVYSFDDKNVTHKSNQYTSPIKIYEGETHLYVATIDELYVSSDTLVLNYKVVLPKLSYEENWMFDKYENDSPYYETECKYVDGKATNETRKTGRIKPDQDKIKEWVNEGYEDDEPYREYERLYIAGEKTESVRYTGKTKPKNELLEKLLSGYWRNNGMTLGSTQVTKFYENGLFYEADLNWVQDNEGPDGKHKYELNGKVLRLYNNGQLYDELTYDGSKFISKIRQKQSSRDEMINGVYVPAKTTPLTLTYQKNRQWD